MRILHGSELAGFIKERQAKQVRALRQAHKVFPRLAVVIATDDQVSATYVRLKQQYGEDILVDVELKQVSAGDILATVKRLNDDPTIHGIIVQLPLPEGVDTEIVLDAVAPEKDVDGLGLGTVFTPATPLAIEWLLAGYNVTLKGKELAIVGAGRLVGGPLAKLWRANGLEPQVYDEATVDLPAVLRTADVIVTATGVPGLITSGSVRQKAVVVDAGTASEHGKIVGDVADDVRERTDVSITPKIGGVGPLTIAALFDNVIQAATNAATTKD